MISTRRSFIKGVAGFFAAPAIVRASSLMPVRTYQTTSLVTGTRAAMLRELMRLTAANGGIAPGTVLVGSALFGELQDAMETPTHSLTIGGVPIIFDKWCPPHDAWATAYDFRSNWRPS